MPELEISSSQSTEIRQWIERQISQGNGERIENEQSGMVLYQVMGDPVIFGWNVYSDDGITDCILTSDRIIAALSGEGIDVTPFDMSGEHATKTDKGWEV